MPDNQIKVLHSQYKYNTRVEQGGRGQDYVVVYFENNATDVMMHGYTQVPDTHIHLQGELNNKDTGMDAFKKLDSAIRNTRFGHLNDHGRLKVNNNFQIDSDGTLGLNIIMLENRAAYNTITTKDEGAIYMWTDNGKFTGIDTGSTTPGSTINVGSLEAHNASPLAHPDIRNQINRMQSSVTTISSNMDAYQTELLKIRSNVDAAVKIVNTFKTTGIDQAALADRARTADKLSRSVTINGVSFDGSQNINIDDVNYSKTTGKLKKAVTINGVTFDGSQNITIPKVDSASTSEVATRLSRAIRINGIEFDGSRDITIPASTMEGFVAENASKLGNVDASEYALKRDVYLRSQTYAKEEVYNKQEVDSLAGKIPGGRIYIV